MLLLLFAKKQKMQISIKPFSSSEVESLVELGQKTFKESHGHSATEIDIQNYVDYHFNTDTLLKALSDSNIYFHKILFDNQLAGYSKLILDNPHPLTSISPIAKFERLYLLKDFYGLGLGKELLKHNIEIARAHQQKAFWIFVWTENENGLKFYKKNDFKIIGTHNFKISDQHSNPNFVMLKLF
jgi:ribosomal protein S18 acetylase RimI-like enzyme